MDISQNSHRDGCIVMECPAHISMAMSQDASVRIRRAAFSLWLKYNLLRSNAADGTGSGPNDGLLGRSLGSRSDRSPEVIKVLAEHLQDKYALHLSIYLQVVTPPRRGAPTWPTWPEWRFRKFVSVCEAHCAAAVCTLCCTKLTTR